MNSERKTMYACRCFIRDENRIVWCQRTKPFPLDQQLEDETFVNINQAYNQLNCWATDITCDYLVADYVTDTANE